MSKIFTITDACKLLVYAQTFTAHLIFNFLNGTFFGSTDGIFNNLIIGKDLYGVHRFLNTYFFKVQINLWKKLELLVLVIRVIYI